MEGGGHSPELAKSPETSINYIEKPALQARLLLGTEALNPAKRDIPDLSANSISSIPSEVDTLIHQKSSEERRAQSPGMDQWKSQMVDIFGKNKEFFQSNDKGKRYAQTIQKITGMDVLNFDATSAQNLYDTFCNSKKVANPSQNFSEKVLSSFDTLSDLENNLDAVEWLGNIFGRNTTKVLSQKIHAQKRISNDESKNIFIEATNKKDTADGPSRVNNPTEEEVQLLEFLTAPAKTTPEPQPIAIPPTNEPTPPNTEDPEKIEFREDPRPVVEMMETVANIPFMADKDMREKYFIENPPEKVTLTNEQAKAIVLEPQKPLFIFTDGGNGRYKTTTNHEVVPHVWDLQVDKSGESEEIKKMFPTPPDHKFTEAADKLSQIPGLEDVTRDDSSTLALAAASAPTPETQAKLYKDFADIFLQAHEKNPDLLDKWISTQAQTGEGANIPSIAYLTSADSRRVEDHSQSIDYALIPGFNYDTRELDLQEFRTTWDTRLKELRQAVDTNQFTMYHHRWIEMLGKAVDINKVIGIIREQSTTPTNTPPSH